MPNTIERYKRPRPEIFIVRKTQAESLKYVSEHCRPLYGSDIQVDLEGNIFYPTWRQVKRTEVGPEDYSLLSETRESEEIYLARRLTTKNPHELRINKITKNGGSVEAAIRSADHVLETELEREKPQMKMVRRRITELFNLFADPSAVTDEQLEEAQRKTYIWLLSVRFNPEMAILEEKQKMARWLTKASGGRDSLARRNPLITVLALEAANREAIKREQKIGEAISKFMRMREALLFERLFSREILEDVTQMLEPQRMPNHYLFKYSEKPAKNAKDVGIVKRMLNTISWQLTQPHVKPYRPAGMEANKILGEVIELLQEDRRRDIVERNLFEEVRSVIEKVLYQYKDIYPKQISL